MGESKGRNTGGREQSSIQSGHSKGVQKENGLSGMSKPIGAEELQRRMLGPEPGKAEAESFRNSADLGITLWTNIPSTLSLWKSNTLTTWCEELTHWKIPWCWERLREEGEGDKRGWDGWMASRTRWTWIWINSRSWRWTGKPGVLQSVGSQRVGHDWATELNCYCVKFEKWNMENGCDQIFLWSYEMGWFMGRKKSSVFCIIILWN